MMDDLRRWADKINDDVDDAFTQFLLGNRSFEKCAVEAINNLLSQDTDTIKEVIEGLDRTIQKLLSAEAREGIDWDDLATDLETFRDSLSFRFNLPVKPRMEAIPPPPPPPPQEPPKPTRKVKTEPPKTAETSCDLMDLLGG